MDDRELLELAARAAGIDAKWIDDDYTREGMWLKGERGPDNSAFWNPLTVDGDALRLAVRLNMNVIINPRGGGVVAGRVVATNNDDNDCTSKETAVRRAIVRAAAALAAAG